jgi:hypothetical protein
VAKPAFALAVRLWGLLWRPRGGKGGEERGARVAAAKALVEVVQQAEVYQYEANRG